MAAESTNISEEGFYSSEGKKDAAKAFPTVILFADQVIEGVVWIEGFEDPVIVSITSDPYRQIDMKCSYLARL